MTRLELFALSFYVQWAGSVIVAICCLYKFSVRPSYVQILCIYALTSVLFSVAQEISIHFFNYAHLNTIGNTFVFLEAIFLSMVFFNSTYFKSFRTIILILLGLYSIFYLLMVFYRPIQSFQSPIRVGRDIQVIALSFTYFVYLLRTLPEKNLLKIPMFWINSACVFFFSGTLISSLTIDYLVHVLKNDLAGYWAFRNFFRFFFCLVLAYAGWMNLQSIKQKAASKG